MTCQRVGTHTHTAHTIFTVTVSAWQKSNGWEKKWPAGIHAKRWHAVTNRSNVIIHQLLAAGCILSIEFRTDNQNMKKRKNRQNKRMKKKNVCILNLFPIYIVYIFFLFSVCLFSLSLFYFNYSFFFTGICNGCHHTHGTKYAREGNKRAPVESELGMYCNDSLAGTTFLIARWTKAKNNRNNTANKRPAIYIYMILYFIFFVLKLLANNKANMPQTAPVHAIFVLATEMIMSPLSGQLTTVTTSYHTHNTQRINGRCVLTKRKNICNDQKNIQQNRFYICTHRIGSIWNVKSIDWIHFQFRPQSSVVSQMMKNFSSIRINNASSASIYVNWANVWSLRICHCQPGGISINTMLLAGPTRKRYWTLLLVMCIEEEV